MKHLLAIAAVIGLGACVHSTPINGPDGKSAVLIEGCRKMGDCFDEAALKCPNGYALITQGSNAVAMPTGGTFVPNGYGGGTFVGYGGSVTKHHIMVRCS